MANRKITYEVGFIGNTSQLQAALKQAVASLQELGTRPQNLQRGLEGAAQAALELNNHLRNAYNADTGKLDLTRFRQELDKGGKSLEDYAKALHDLGPEGEQAFMQVATAIGAAELPLKRSNQLLNQLWITMKNTARWRLTTGVLNAFIGGLQQAFGYSKSLNASLNDIRIVTGKSADEMARFAKEANQAAKELSTTTTTYTDASLIYYQQGLDDQAVKERTDTTIKMANVTGQSAETISSQMTAVWNNFKDGSRTLESYADTMVALGASTASSSKEIAEGLGKFAPIADSVGLSFDYASAALATLVATTRESASIAGNALKTLFSRLEGLKLGETLDDGTDLNKYSQALYTVGINIKDANGELKDMDDILAELGNRWQTLARDEQMALAQTVGGVRQYVQLVALMDNWEVFQQNLTTARTAEGSLEKQAQIYAESWEAARDRVKAATEDVYDSLINPKVFIDLDKMAQAVLKPLASVLDAVGGLTGLLPIAAALMTKVYSAQIANVMRDMAVNIGLMTGKEQERARAIQATFVAETEKLGIDYRDDQLMTEKLAILRQQVGIQGEINAKADQYSEYQMAQIKNSSYIIELLKKQALIQNEQIQKAQQALVEQQDTLRFSIGFSNNRAADTNVIMQQIQGLRTDAVKKIFGEPTQQYNLFRTGDLTQVFSTVDTAFQSIAQRTVQIDNLRTSLGEVNKESDDWRLRVENLARSLGLLAEGAHLSDEQLNQLRQDVAIGGKVASDADSDFRRLQQILSTLGADQSTIIAYTARLRDLERQKAIGELTTEQYNKKVQELHEELELGIKNVTDWADTLVGVASGASRAAMAIQSVNNVIQVLSDESLSASERVTRGLTSIAMVIPAITSAVKGFTAAATAAEAATSWAMVAVVAITLIVKALDHIIVTQKEASKAIQESVDAYKEAASELKSLESELKTTQDRLKELQELAESGSISIVEQEELRDLKIENAQLQRQIDLKKELKRVKAQEALTTYQENKNNAYSFTGQRNKLKDYAEKEGLGSASGNPVYEIATKLQDALWDTREEVDPRIIDEVIHQIKTNFITGYYNKEDAIADLGSLAEANSEILEETFNELELLREGYAQRLQGEQAAQFEELLSQTSNLAEWYNEGFIDEEQYKKEIVFLNEKVKEFYELTPGAYENLFLKPIFDALSPDQFQEVFDNNITVDTKKVLYSLGITEEQAQDYAEWFLNNARIEVQKFLEEKGLGLDTSNMGYIELQPYLNLSDPNYAQFQELVSYIENKEGRIPVSFQVEAAQNATIDTLKSLASGKLLNEDTISKLQELYAGLLDFSSFNDLSVQEQIDFLTNQASNIASDKLSDLNGELEKYQTKLEKTQNTITKLQKVTRPEDLIELSYAQSLEENYKTIIDDITEQINNLKEQIEKDPWVVNIELGAKTAAEINNVKKAISLINEDFTVSAENLVELAKRYPEALTTAYYDEAQNVLKIEESKYDSMKELLNGRLDDQRDEQAQILTMQAAASQAILNIVKAEKEEERKEALDTLKQSIDNQEISLDTVKRVTAASMAAVVRAEIVKRKEDKETALQRDAASNAYLAATGSTAEEIVKVYREAAQEIIETYEALYRLLDEGQSIVVGAEEFQGFSGDDYNRIKQSAFQAKYNTTQSSFNKELEKLKSDSSYQQWESENQKLEDLAKALDNIANGTETTWNTLQKYFYNLSQESQDALGSEFKTLITQRPSSAKLDEYLGTVANFVEEQDAGQQSIQDIFNKAIETLQHLLESPETDKTKSGSGGKLDYAKLDNADLEKHEDLLEEIEDRYHEITREIERQNRILNQLETQAERTYGLDRLKLYEKELEELNRLYEKQRAKQGRAERYLADVDKLRLQTAFQAIGTKEGVTDILGRYGFSGFSNIAVDLSKPGQEIKDFEALEDNIRQDTENFLTSYHAFMVEYDNFLQEYNALTDEDKANQQERALQLQQEYELVTAQFEIVKAQQEERLAAIKQYEETLDTINTLAHEMEETLRREEDTKLKEITHRMDVILDVRDARKQIRDFSKEIAESFGDALTHGLQTASLGWDQAKDEMAMYKEYVQEYNDLKSLLDNATEYTDTEAIVAELKELEGNIIESGQRLLEWSEQVENMFVDALNAAADRFSYFTNQLEHNDEILATIKELYALQGQTYKTQQGFTRLQRVAQERLETQIGQAKLQRKWFEEADAKLQEAQAQLDALIAEKGAEAEQDFRYDTFKKNRDALLKEQQEAQKAMLNAAQEAMETAQQMYLDQIEKAVYEFGQTLSGGFSLDLLQEKYDHYIEEEERYLDKVNEAYQVAAWYDKLQKDIDNTSNKLTKDRLKALQEEIDIRREGNTLSQYDLDILEAKYKVTQAQMALEDAQNNKSQLRLVRDRSGNWNYQFTLNEDDIADKEKDLINAENEWYNIAKQQTKETTGEIIATWQECQEKLSEIYSDISNFVMNEETGRLELTKEANQKAVDLYEFYVKKVQYLRKEQQIATDDMTEAGNQSMIHMALAAGEEVADITGITGEDVTDIIKITGQSVQDLLQMDLSQINAILIKGMEQTESELQSHSDIIRDIVGDNTSLINLFDNTYAEILTDMTKGTSDFNVALDEYIAEMQNRFKDYGDTVAQVSDDCGVSLNELDDQINNVSDSTDKMTQQGFAAADSLWRQLEATWDAQQGYLDLAAAVWEYIYALQALAAEQVVSTIESASNVDTFNEVDEYDSATDWSLKMGEAAKAGDWEAVDTYGEYRERKFNEGEFDRSQAVSTEDLKDAFKEAYGETTGKKDDEMISLLEEVLTGDKYYRDVIPIASAATGMYTGDFDNGRLAILHEKELVLNQEDTKNILNAVQMVRTMQDKFFGNLANQLNSDGLAAMALLGQKIGGVGLPAPASSDLEQHVIIEQVSFPGVTSSREIEEAFENLVNDAAQWARRTKS